MVWQAWQVRRVLVRLGEASPGEAWYGRHGQALRGLARRGKVRSGDVWYGRHGRAWKGAAGHGSARLGRYGLASQGVAMQGEERSGTQGGGVTGEEFTKLHRGCLALREYILIQAKRHSKLEEQQEDSVQEAWLMISVAPPGLSIEAYQDLAYRAIYSHYWQEYKHRQLFRDNDWIAEAAKHKTPERAMSDDIRYGTGKNWRH